MPKYFLVARDGQEARSPRAFSAADLRAYKNAAHCFTFVNELTNSVKNVGACLRRNKRGYRLADGAPAATAPAPAPAAPAPTVKPVAGARRRRRRSR